MARPTCDDQGPEVADPPVHRRGPLTLKGYSSIGGKLVQDASRFDVAETRHLRCDRIWWHFGRHHALSPDGLDVTWQRPRQVA